MLLHTVYIFTNSHSFVIITAFISWQLWQALVTQTVVVRLSQARLSEFKDKCCSWTQQSRALERKVLPRQKLQRSWVKIPWDPLSRAVHAQGNITGGLAERNCHGIENIDTRWQTAMEMLDFQTRHNIHATTPPPQHPILTTETPYLISRDPIWDFRWITVLRKSRSKLCKPQWRQNWRWSPTVLTRLWKKHCGFFTDG